jgi:hypothetical protein
MRTKSLLMALGSMLLIATSSAQYDFNLTAHTPLRNGVPQFVSFQYGDPYVPGATDVIVTDGNGDLTLGFQLATAEGMVYSATPCPAVGSSWNYTNGSVSDSDPTLELDFNNCDSTLFPGAPCVAEFIAYQTGTTSSPYVPVADEIDLFNFSRGGSGVFSYLWDFGDGSTSSDQEASHVFPDAGPYLVTLSIDDGMGCTSSFADTLLLDENGMYQPMGVATDHQMIVHARSPMTSMGIGAAQHLADLHIQPSIVEQGEATLVAANNEPGLLLYTIQDAMGRTLGRGQERVGRGITRIPLALAPLTSGSYFLRVANGGAERTVRFMKL